MFPRDQANPVAYKCILFPRDQATPVAYKCILPLQTSYINGMLDHGGGGGGCQTAKKTNDDPNPTNYLFSFILVKPVACLYTLSTCLNMTWKSGQFSSYG